MEATENRPRFSRLKRALPFSLILVVFGALYFPTLNNEMVWDDHSLLVDSVGTSNPDSIGRALTTPYLEMIDFVSTAPPYYRPFSMAVLMVERRIFGTHPLGYRIVHGLLHLLNVLLLFGLAGRLARDGGASAGISIKAATVTSLLFLTLPYTVEAVCFLTDLGDLLALTSLLSSVLITRSYVKSGKPLFLAALFLMMALGVTSKETAAVTPAVLLVFGLLFGGAIHRRRLAALLTTSILPIIGFLLIRASVVSESIEIDLVSAIQRFPHDLVIALRWSLAPHPEALEHPLPVDPPITLTILGVSLMVGSAFLLWKLRHRAPGFVAGVLAWFLTLAPSMVPLHMLLNFPTRYLYIPAAWLALIVGPLFLRRPRIGLVAAAGLVLSLGLLAAIRVQTWNNSFDLWTAETETYPDRPYNLIQLAKAVEDAGDQTRAASIFELSLRVADTRRDSTSMSFAHQELGSILLEQNRLDDALLHYKEALNIDKKAVGAWIGLGNIHGKDGSWNKALAAYDKVLVFLPDNFNALIARAGALAALGRYDEAQSTLDRAEKIASGYPEKAADVRQKRAVIKKLQKDRNRAVR